VALHGDEREHRLKAAAGVVHNRTLIGVAAVGKALSCTYLIKPKPNGGFWV